jgi:hypothetical protein
MELTDPADVRRAAIRRRIIVLVCLGVLFAMWAMGTYDENHQYDDFYDRYQQSEQSCAMSVYGIDRGQDGYYGDLSDGPNAAAFMQCVSSS